MSDSLVSIGLPVYNGADYLETAIENLLSQTHSEIELIIADNASTDRSLEIAQSAADRDARVRVLPAQENLGAAWNYNRAVESATGRYFKWAAHDDLCEPTYVERCVEALDADDGLVLAYPKTVIINEHGDRVRDYEDNLDIGHASASARAAALMWRVGLCNAVFGVIRTEALRDTAMIGLFDSSDVSLLAELALRGRFHEVPERLFLRRRHMGASRKANTDARSVAAWFGDSAKAGRSRSLLGGYAAAVRRWDAGPVEKAKAAAVFATVGPLTEIRWHLRNRRRTRAQS